MKVARHQRLLLATTSLAVVALLGIGRVYKRGTAMTTPIMMYAGSDDHRFDATQWFSGGMYKRRQIEVGGRVQNDDMSMLRVAPPPFIPAQQEELSSWAFVALNRELPGVDAHSLLENPPDLRHRTLYRGSGFDAPDKPIDSYNIYLSLNDKRYVVDIERDGMTGKIIHAGSVLGVPASDTKTNLIFDRLEAEERAWQIR